MYRNCQVRAKRPVADSGGNHFHGWHQYTNAADVFAAADDQLLADHGGAEAAARTIQAGSRTPGLGGRAYFVSGSTEAGAACCATGRLLAFDPADP